MEIRTRDASNLSNTSSSYVQTALTLNTKETHMARTVAYVTGVLVLCYSFLIRVTSMADMFVEDDVLFDHLLYPLAETVTFLNSSLNPFLYCWRCIRRDLREKIWFVLKGAKYRVIGRIDSKNSREVLQDKIMIQISHQKETRYIFNNCVSLISRCIIWTLELEVQQISVVAFPLEPKE